MTDSTGVESSYSFGALGRAKQVLVLLVMMFCRHCSTFVLSQQPNPFVCTVYFWLITIQGSPDQLASSKVPPSTVLLTLHAAGPLSFLGEGREPVLVQVVLWQRHGGNYGTVGTVELSRCLSSIMNLLAQDRFGRTG